MATTLYSLTPEAAHYPSSNPMAYARINDRPVLAADADTAETAYWTFVAPQGLGSLTAIVHFFMASATSGSVDVEVSLECLTPDSDSVDMDATTSFDTANSNNGTVPSTAGYPSDISVTLTNDDSIAAGDYCRLRLARDADDGTNDTATGDCYFTLVELRGA